MNIIPDGIDFAKYAKETDARQNVKAAKIYLDDLIASVGKPRPSPGSPMPWEKTRRVFHFRPGEVTLWAGVNGHGKSLLTGMVALDLIVHGQRTCIASFEMKPYRTLQRMLRQWVGYDAETEFQGHHQAVDAIREVYADLNVVCEKRLWFYDQQGTVDVERICGVARYCAKELGVQHLFIDSLMKCVKGEDDYNGQKAFVDEMTAIARDYGMHIHVVHHIRKLENELRQPDKTDVKGTGAITDQVDNVLLVWRNKADNRKDSDPDATVSIVKQRNGEWEGRVQLWFDRGSQQFLEGKGMQPIDWTKRVA